MTLGEKIKYKREINCISQQALADKIGVNSPQVISNWELDKSAPDTDKFLKICIALNTPLTEFYPIAANLPEYTRKETSTPGRRLNFLINKKGYKHKKFAELSGVIQNTLSKFINDKQPMSDKYIMEAAKVLGVPFEYIKYGTEGALTFEQIMEWKEKADKYDQIKKMILR